MAIGPRLEFRQSQSLVMTPQLRQAIKLLQFSNMEVAAYIEEELERNPLLERDEKMEGVPERPAPDQRVETARPHGYRRPAPAGEIARRGRGGPHQQLRCRQPERRRCRFQPRQRRRPRVRRR